MHNTERPTATYNVEPYQGAAGVKFGMTRCDVAKAIGGPEGTFHRGGEERDPGGTDQYSDFFVSYDADGACEAIEFFGGEVRCEGILLFPNPYADALEKLQEAGVDLLCNGDGCTSLALGVGVYAPFARDILGGEEADGDVPLVESVIAFRKGYYDDLVEAYPGILGVPVEEWLAPARRERSR